MFFDLFVLVVCSFVGGGVCHALFSWGLERRTYSLECDVADLKEKILVEIKKRAAHSRVKDVEFLEKLEEAAKREPEKPPNQFWWQTIPKA